MMRGRVLTGVQVTATRADLATVSARPARGIVVSPELVESAKQEGFAAGFDEGYAEGYSQGMNDAAHHIDLLGQLVERLRAETDALAAREATARADIEDQVIETAFQIAELIIGRELEQPETRVLDAMARALDLAPDQGLVAVRLHPADIAAIGDRAETESGRAMRLVPDQSLSPGDCVVDVGACRVDARIGAALERIREVLS
jgi:flagellar assembly protein FliH